MLKLDDISVQYKGSAHAALSSVNLSFEKGDFVCILGKSGAGKSTLIRTINGLQPLSSGEVYWKGDPLSSKTEEEARKTRREMGMIFQHFNLVPRLSVLQNVLTGMFGHRSSFKNLIGWFTTEEVRRAKEVIAEVGLSEFADRRVEHLSGGQKQRVGIARALLQKPEVLLGDEPVASLDPGTSSHIFSLIKQMHDHHDLLTIINVHDVSLAKKFAGRIIALKEGKVIFDGKAVEFSDREYVETYGSESYELV
ncbi:phosphonate ABC transporter ATP-binding protein [Bacillus salacetis]|uniref:Phosphonate ABC transporter ATP-binding protein n=1 Tax=Bacillus salacetis TaxID=2315464 RepID=A0A3A1R3L8_9BACI|nr:phosphonate ABC transporter ATP-binding protein [Bacillus salacetis]RIW37308.1 phosphonate ABC transporter ATP-binding protein [Bacillus salacetis]